MSPTLTAFWLCADLAQPADPDCADRMDLDLSSDLEQLSMLDWRKEEPAFLAEMLHGASLDEQCATLPQALPSVFDGWPRVLFFPPGPRPPASSVAAPGPTRRRVRWARWPSGWPAAVSLRSRSPNT